MVQVIRDPQTRREVLYIDNPPPANYLGTTGLVFSILGLVTCGVLSPIGLLLSVIGLTGKRRGGAIAGILLSLLGLAIPGALLFSEWKEHRDSQRERVVQQARATLESARVKIDEKRAEEKALPDGVAGNRLLLKEGFRDPWNSEIRYELHDDDRSYSLRSPGPDAKFDTRDDVSISIAEDALHEPIAGGQEPGATVEASAHEKPQEERVEDQAPGSRAKARSDEKPKEERRRRNRDKGEKQESQEEVEEAPRYEPLELDLDLEYEDREE
ncbi:MAG TPA: hypothetical protein VGN57_04665 [Pirellulaceae bacterium]|jgi:hypothetical protein|nr:hypothetical protein [Pirellulaceae bacterium]